MIDQTTLKQWNPLQEVHVDPIGKNKYKVAHDFSQWFNIRGRTFRIDIEKGYITDLASIPRALWAIYPPDGLYRAAAICHDLIFQICGPRGENRAMWLFEVLEDGSEVAVQVRFTKKEGNLIFKQLMQDWDTGWWTVGTFYNAVQMWPFAW